MKTVMWAPGNVADLLSGECGAPLIPIGSEAEINSYQEILRLHDCVFLETSATKTAPQKSVKRSGLVVAYGSATVPAATLYAHLTERMIFCADDLSSLPKITEIAVIVSSTKSVTYDFMAFVTSRCEGDSPSVPGLILGNNADELIISAKRWAISLFCAGSSSEGKIFIHPALQFKAVERPEGMFVGGLESSQNIIAAAKSGAAVLTMVSPSTGYDIRVFPKLYICPIELNSDYGEIEPRPICIDLKRCTQLHGAPALDEAWSAGGLRNIQTLRARTLILISCSVVQIGESNKLSSAFSIANALSQRGTLGACVTTWRPEQLDRAGTLLNGLINDLSEGMAIGKAVGKFNRSRGAETFGTKLCVLGDPEYVVRSRDCLFYLPEWDSGGIQEQKHDVTPMSLSYLLLKRAILQEAPGRLPISPAPAEKALVSGINEAVDASLRGLHNSREIRELRKKVNDGVVNFLATWRKFDTLLTPYVHSKGPMPPTLCAVCKMPVTNHHLKSRLGSLPDWAQSTCAACEATALAPVGVPWMIFCDLDSPRKFKLAKNDSEMTVVMSVFNLSYSALNEPGPILFNWPQEDGQLLAEFELPATLPRGILGCYSYIVSDDFIGAWTSRIINC